MLGGAGPKKIFPLKMLDGAGIKNLLSVNILEGGCYEKPPISQCVRRGWHKKALSAENDSQGMYVGICFNLIC